MNNAIEQAISLLKAEQRRISTALAQLEPASKQVASTGKKVVRRYSDAQKKAISKRMKAAWAKRKAT